MTPVELLAHSDSGQLWPAGAGAAFTALPQAYGSALAVRALRLARGERARGFKVGFTNRTIWQRYGVYAPIWGSVWDTTASDCDGSGRVALQALCQPRIEPEAVFGFKAPPPAGGDLEALFASLDWIAPGFEIVQSHLPDWKFQAAQTVADGGLHGRLLVGRRTPVAALADGAQALDQALCAARVRLFQGEAVREEGCGANVLDSPLRALLHFLVELRACPGAPDIVPGDIVTTGTWTDAWPVQPGQTWSAHFDALLPALEVRFTSSQAGD